MLLTEKKKKRHLKLTFEEGRKEGYTKGREDKLKELVMKKYSKGKSIYQIAEDLEEEVSVIERMIER